MTVFIENEARYEAAIQARIKINASKGRSRRWKAAHADAERLEAWLDQTGEFADQHRGDGIWKSHPAAPRGEFYAKMGKSLREWGGLTDSQTEAVRKGLQQALDRAAGRELAKTAQREIDLQSAHVAVVGKRADFEAVVDFSTSFETIYGTSYIYGLRDAGGNILIIKGSTPVQISKGQKVKFAAFVKAHGERDGVKQTLLNRVKIKEVAGE